MSKRLLAVFLTFVASVAAAATPATSVYIPGVGTEAISASEIGTGAQGTTWLIEPAHGGATGSDGVSIGPATLVVGPSSMEFVYKDSVQSVSEGCVYKGSSAVCVVDYAVTGVTTFATTTTAPISYFTLPVTGSSSGAGASQTTSGAARVGLSSTLVLGAVGAAMFVLN